jgi:RIP metalloprotease RseP
MTVVYALIAISIIIFIHELGHFLAAKKVGVRVERFSIGFDPPIAGRKLRVFAFERGGTEYVLGAIPFGGYVKLAGEIIPEASAEKRSKPASDELLAKSPSQRALIFVAGSAMNILSGFLFFMVAFTLGVSFTGPEIGNSIPGTPAWDAGILPGDRVTAVNDEEVSDFTEMRVAIALSERGQPLRLRVARSAGEGTDESLEFEVTPRWQDSGFNEIGVVPSISPVVEPPKEGSSFQKAGLRAGDLVIGVELAGTRLPPMAFSALMDALQSYVNLRPGEPLRLLIDRAGAREWIEVVPELAKEGSPRPQLGVVRGTGNVVRGMRESSTAATIFERGDRLVAVGGQPVGSVGWLSIVESWSGVDGKLELELRPLTGDSRTVVVERDNFLVWTLRGDIHWDDFALEVAELGPNSPLAAAGLAPGDGIRTVRGRLCYSQEDLSEILAELAVSGSGSFPVPLEVAGSHGTRTIELSREATESLGGVTWQSMPPLQAVLRGGPADQVGIAPGSRIRSLGGERVHSWEGLLEKVTSTAVGREVAVTWVDAAGQENEGVLRTGVTPFRAVTLPFTYKMKTIQASPLSAVGLGAKRTVLVIKQVFLTVRSLLRRDVSAKHLAGPVGIVHLFTNVVERGDFGMLIFWLALISVNLGLFNLFPFPILDGGHLLFLGIEKLKGSPVDVRIQEWAVNVAFILIICLALFVTFNDVRRLFE